MPIFFVLALLITILIKNIFLNNWAQFQLNLSFPFLNIEMG
jgi:hypothetical protein